MINHTETSPVTARTGTEILAGITTFLTMAYVIFVNPAILGFQNVPGLAGQGLPQGPTMVMTCFSAGILCILMGLVAKAPVAMAAGMGFNAMVAFGLVATLKLSWPEAMGIVVLEGVLILVLVLTHVRIWIMDAIPMNLKRAIGVGIGLFITILGFQNAGLMVSHPATLFQFGSLFIRDAAGTMHPNGSLLLALAGLFICCFLLQLKIRGALFLGIILTAILGYFVGLTKLPTAMVSVPDFSTFLQVDFAGGFIKLGFFSWFAVIFALMMTDFFDTMGTVFAIGEQAKLLDAQGRFPRIKQVLIVDSCGAIFGGLCSCSSVTSYIESLAGIASGGRTGLMSITAGILFLICMFFAPLAGIIPPQATAPVLILVGFFMIRIVRDIEFDHPEEALPAFLIMVGIPLSFEISRGIGYGFIAYTLLKLFSRQRRELHPLMVISAVLFAVSFILHF